MDDERRRILRMLAEGTISVDECEELLRALSDRRTDKVERELRAAKGKRPIWPYVLLIALALSAFPVWRIGVGAVKGILGGFAGPFGLLLLIFWVWMLVDCVKRRREDFRLLFTEMHEHEKWIWCAIVLLAGWVGALAYLVVIRQPARSITPPRPRSDREKPAAPDPEPARPEEPFTPWPKARSLWAFVLVGLLIALGLPLAIGGVAAAFGTDASWFIMHLPHEIRSDVLPYIGGVMGLTFIGWLVGISCVLVLWLVIFQLWMLIDCLARDHREFGTLITSDKSLDKLLWLCLIFIFPVIGGLAYHLSVRRRPRHVPRVA